MESKAISDTGPIIHLKEIEALQSIGIFKNILIPPAVNDELIKNKISLP